MSAFHITGKHRLEGSLRVHGAKNSVLPILAATLVSGGVSVVRNCPCLKDVDSSIRILSHLGCKVRREGDAVVVDSSGMNRVDIPDGLMREMRSSVVFLGAILARAGEALMSFPGGCELGPRPIDLHLSSLRALGAQITEESGTIICRAPALRGAEITLSFPSVGATENVMLAACKSEGVTRINNAAKEPEIEDLQDFLNAIGGRVSGAGTSTVVVEGTQTFQDADHAIIPDRIVASTLLASTAAAGGDVTLTGVKPVHFAAVCATFQESGCQLEIGTETVRLRRGDAPLRAVRPLRTMPYPGFPTDAQAPVMAALACAQGSTIFVENIFESRYRHVGELARMGADIRVEGRVAVVCGVPGLFGTQVSSTDLRGGASLVVAGLAAEGKTVVSTLDHIDRGYDRLEEQLTALGAEITRAEKS